jgi:hypothetical protein
MRRITEHKKRSFDGEELQILIVWEEGYNKEQIKKELPYSKKHDVLISSGQLYDFRQKRA